MAAGRQTTALSSCGEQVRPRTGNDDRRRFDARLRPQRGRSSTPAHGPVVGRGIEPTWSRYSAGRSTGLGYPPNPGDRQFRQCDTTMQNDSKAPLARAAGQSGPGAVQPPFPLRWSHSAPRAPDPFAGHRAVSPCWRPPARKVLRPELESPVIVQNPERLLTPGEVALLFRVDPKTVTRWASAGRIGSIRTPGGTAGSASRRSMIC